MQATTTTLPLPVRPFLLLNPRLSELFFRGWIPTISCQHLFHSSPRSLSIRDPRVWYSAGLEYLFRQNSGPISRPTRPSKRLQCFPDAVSKNFRHHVDLDFDLYALTPSYSPGRHSRLSSTPTKEHPHPTTKEPEAAEGDTRPIGYTRG